MKEKYAENAFYKLCSALNIIKVLMVVKSILKACLKYIYLHILHKEFIDWEKTNILRYG